MSGTLSTTLIQYAHKINKPVTFALFSIQNLNYTRLITKRTQFQPPWNFHLPSFGDRDTAFKFFKETFSENCTSILSDLAIRWWLPAALPGLTRLKSPRTEWAHFSSSSSSVKYPRALAILDLHLWRSTFSLWCTVVSFNFTATSRHVWWNNWLLSCITVTLQCPSTFLFETFWRFFPSSMITKSNLIKSEYIEILFETWSTFSRNCSTRVFGVCSSRTRVVFVLALGAFGASRAVLGVECLVGLDYQ